VSAPTDLSDNMGLLTHRAIIVELVAKLRSVSTKVISRFSTVGQELILKPSSGELGPSSLWHLAFQF
jgi:hypothetical protein